MGGKTCPIAVKVVNVGNEVQGLKIDLRHG
jgi:hypothetical protein